MSTIRRQSIISTFLIFLGFGIGFLNNLFFTRQEWFTVAEYGLTRSFFDFSQVIFACSFLGATSVMYKFYPYYQSHLTDKKNDLLSWSLLSSLIGFLLFLASGIIFKPFFIRKFGAKSPLLINFYLWIYVFGFFSLVFQIIESYCWSLKKTIITNFLKETVLRLFTTVLIILFIFKYISYYQFIRLFSLLYSFILVILLVYLKRNNKLHFTFKPSSVTQKLKKKIAIFALFIFGGVIVSTVSANIDSIIISSLLGQTSLGIFALSSYVSNLIQVPQRSVAAIAIPILSEAWKKKDIDTIERIYKRSSINLLLGGLFIFGNIWLNYEDAITAFRLNPEYLTGKYVAFFMALKLIVDMGTGVNGQIITTSNYWKFDFLTGIILLALTAPLNYILIKKLGIVGSGISNLLAYIIYNAIRMVFLWSKFRLQPFSIKTAAGVLLALISYILAWYFFREMHGWRAIILKSSFFSAIFITLTWHLKLTPDFEPVMATIKKRIKRKQ